MLRVSSSWGTWGLALMGYFRLRVVPDGMVFHISVQLSPKPTRDFGSTTANLVHAVTA